MNNSPKMQRFTQKFIVCFSIFTIFLLLVSRFIFTAFGSMLMLVSGNFFSTSCVRKLFPRNLLINFRQVVYLADTNGYIPLNSLRGPAPPIAPQLYAGADLEAWRPELWDRDYNRRYRFNNTKVQRELMKCKPRIFS